MATLQKEICISSDNKPGTLSRAAGCIKEAGVSVTGCCGWGEGGKANLYFLTDNNGKAVAALQKGGYTCREQEVVCCTLQNRVGTLAEACQKLGQGGINIDHCYVTAQGPNALWVVYCNDNKKAQGLLP